MSIAKNAPGERKRHPAPFDLEIRKKPYIYHCSYRGVNARKAGMESMINESDHEKPALDEPQKTVFPVFPPARSFAS
jgi:hypothetical protein